MGIARRFLNRLGFKWDLLDPEEAAKILLEREVTFVWRPQIVEKANGLDHHLSGSGGSGPGLVSGGVDPGKD